MPLPRRSDGSVLLRAVCQPNPTSPKNRSAGAVVDVPPSAALNAFALDGPSITLRTSNQVIEVKAVIAIRWAREA